MTEKKIIELLKSGNFTIIYWDNTIPSLYEGKLDVDNFPENKKEISTGYWDNGYCPNIVTLLAKALGGKADSI